MTDREHPLLRPFPLLVMSVATFLVLFALLMARLHQSFVPRLAPGTSAQAESNQARPITTTAASGSVSPAAASAGGRRAAAPTGSRDGRAAPFAVTRTSGVGAVGGEVDE